MFRDRPSESTTICWRLLIVSKARSNSRKVLATRQGAMSFTGSITTGPHYEAHWSREPGSISKCLLLHCFYLPDYPSSICILQPGADTLSCIAALFRVAPPGSKVRDPPWDICAEFFVLKPVALPQGGLFVNENEEIKSRPNYKSVFKNANTAEKQPLTEN